MGDVIKLRLFPNMKKYPLHSKRGGYFFDAVKVMVLYYSILHDISRKNIVASFDKLEVMYLQINDINLLRAIVTQNGHI